MKKTFLFAFYVLVACCNITFAQTGVYIAAGADVVAHKTDTISIFSDVENNGNLGSYKGTVINFYGKRWKNGAGATLPDEHDYVDSLPANGGIFRFIQTSKNAQYINGGYSIATNSGASFPNISINNGGGLMLENSDTKIRNILNFTKGNAFLSGRNLVVGNGNPGQITGYNDQQFVVTGQSKIVGLLIREHVSSADSVVTFPIGTTADSYTPLAIRNYDKIADNFYAGVFDNIYEKGSYGNIIQKPQVKKTWNFRRNSSLPANLAVWLQHDDKNEDIHFKLNRDSSYVSLYNQGWDSTYPTGTMQPGTLTSGSPISSSYLNFRHFYNNLPSNNYFAVVSPKSSKDRTSNVSISFNAWRTDIRWVKADWFTYWEININHFELQRRRITEDSFHTVGTMPASSVAGPLVIQEKYTTNDDNYYDRWSYYRVKGVGNDGTEFYSRIELVPNFVDIKPYPNPSNGSFNIQVFGVTQTMKLNIVSSAGQVVHTQLLNGSGTVNRKDLPSGIYFLFFYDTENKNTLIYKQKIEILH